MEIIMDTYTVYITSKQSNVTSEYEVQAESEEQAVELAFEQVPYDIRDAWCGEYSCVG